MLRFIKRFMSDRQYANLNEAELNSRDKRIILFKEYINSLSAETKDGMTVDLTVRLLGYFLYEDKIDYVAADEIVTNG